MGRCQGPRGKNTRPREQKRSPTWLFRHSKKVLQGSQIPRWFVLRQNDQQPGPQPKHTSPLRPTKNSPFIAQLVEHLTVDLSRYQMVPGSIPGERICFSKARRRSGPSLQPHAKRHTSILSSPTTSKKQMQNADSTLRSSQAVPHPSTNRALRHLTSEFGRDPVHWTRYGRQRSTYLT